MLYSMIGISIPNWFATSLALAVRSVILGMGLGLSAESTMQMVSKVACPPRFRLKLAYFGYRSRTMYMLRNDYAHEILSLCISNL